MNNFDRFAEHVRENLYPQMKASQFVISIVPLNLDGVDVKFSVELGFAIMLDKPIVAVIRPGTVIPKKLAAVVDRFVEFDLDDPTTHERIAEAVLELANENGI